MGKNRAALMSGLIDTVGRPGEDPKKYYGEKRRREAKKLNQHVFVKCPGGCGGQARQDSEVTVALGRDNEVRYYFRATCLSKRCRRADGKPYPATFEVPAEKPAHVPLTLASRPPIPSEPTPEPTAPEPTNEEKPAMGIDAPPKPTTRPERKAPGVTYEAERSRLASALEKVGRTVTSVGKELGCGNNLSAWLRTGSGVGPKKVEEVMAWVELVEEADDLSLLSPEPEPKPAAKPKASAAEELKQSYKEVFEGEAATAVVAPEPNPYREMLRPIFLHVLLEGLAARNIPVPDGYELEIALVRKS